MLSLETVNAAIEALNTKLRLEREGVNKGVKLGLRIPTFEAARDELRAARNQLEAMEEASRDLGTVVL